MPAALAEVVSDFAEVQGQDKLTLLLEFANELPALPADLEEAAMEPVPECQSPLFLHVDATDAEHVRLFLARRPKHRRHAGSPRSWPPAWTGNRPPTSSRCPTISTPNWGWRL